MLVYALIAGLPAFALEPTELLGALPTSIDGMKMVGTDASLHETTNLPEATVSFQSDKATINLYVADLGSDPAIYEQFLAGRGLRQTSGGQSFNTVEASQFTEGLGIGMRQSTGVGAIEIAQSSGILLDEKGIEVEKILLSSGGVLTAAKFNLEQSTGLDSSYIIPHVDREYDVAGWDVYDTQSQTALFVLGVNSRFGLLIEGAGVADLASLQLALEKVDMILLEKLASY